MGRSAPSPAPSQMQGTEGFAIGEGFTVQAFKRYVSSVVFHGWKPQFVVLHHTVIPTIQQWHAMTGETATTRLSEFFKGRGWKGAYHVLIADDLVWLLTPLDRQGVHSPSWNRMSFGVSMIGNYDEESLNREPGKKVLENTIDVIATLDKLIGADPGSLRLHREDPLSRGRTCPGVKVDKQYLIKMISLQH